MREYGYGINDEIRLGDPSALGVTNECYVGHATRFITVACACWADGRYKITACDAREKPRWYHPLETRVRHQLDSGYDYDVELNESLRELTIRHIRLIRARGGIPNMGR